MYVKIWDFQWNYAKFWDLLEVIDIFTFSQNFIIFFYFLIFRNYQVFRDFPTKKKQSVEIFKKFWKLFQFWVSILGFGRFFFHPTQTSTWNCANGENAAGIHFFSSGCRRLTPVQHEVDFLKFDFWFLVIAWDYRKLIIAIIIIRIYGNCSLQL